MDQQPEVVFIGRSDWNSKNGGDRIQVEAYVEHFQAAGRTSAVMPFSVDMEIPPGAIVHLVNIDRVYDFLLAAKMSMGHLVYVSPIHHDLRLVRVMRRGTRNARGRAALANRMPEQIREYLGFLVRSVFIDSVPWRRRVGVIATTMNLIVRPWERAGDVLDRAEAVFLLAPGEKESLVRDTKWHARNAVLTPNGVELPKDLTRIEWPERSTDLLVVGRIEARKRCVELAEAAIAGRVRIRFIGAPGNDASYVKEFVKVVDSSPDATWAGQRDHVDVLREMASHRVLVNGSYVEVQSLVDLEAASVGCVVVSTPAGHSADWLGEWCRQLGSFDASELIILAAKIAQSSSPPDAPLDYPHTWASSSSRILNAYWTSLAVQKVR